MRILHIVPTYLPAWRHGGPIYAVHGLAKALVARGHEVTVFTTDVHGTGRLDVPLDTPVDLDGVTVRYFPITFPRRLYRPPALGAALNRQMPQTDLVHLHSVFLWPTTAAARAAERTGVPYLLAPRGMLVPDLLSRRGWLRKRLWIALAERRTIERSAALHVTSALEGEEAARLHFRLPPVHVVPNGVDPADGSWGRSHPRTADWLREAPEGGRPQDRTAPGPGDVSPAVGQALTRAPLLLYLGRISWKKGLDRLIPALPQVPEATLAVAGNDEEGYRSTLEKLAHTHGVADRVFFLGPVQGADKAALLNEAAALVLPSYSENFGNVVLEAMAAGCPVVVTPEVGLAGIVEETQAGVVVPGDPLLLGNALRDLLADPERRAEMGRKGAEAARERFGWGTIAEQMEKIYATMLSPGSGDAVRIAFLVERPTQFEAPFFQYVAGAAGAELRVLFTGVHVAKPVFDPELGREVAWGIDLLGGYPSAVCPPRGRTRWLAREITRERCDLLIVNGYTQRTYLLATAIARNAGVPTALRLDSVLWDDRADPGSRKLVLFSALLLHLYDLFLGVGTLTLDYLAACGVPPERRGLFPYAVDVEHFRAASRLSAEERAAARVRLGLGEDDRAVLAVAKMNSREAPWDLLRALPALPTNVHLLLAGDGPARPELQSLAAGLAPDRVRFLGYVPYGELPALYAAADLFVHPVKEERWGVSVAEALACGLPVVTSSRVGAGHDLVIPGQNGGVYPAGDPRALADRIAAALTLDSGTVAATSRAVLGRWDYPAAWRSLQEAATRAAAYASGGLP